MTAETVLITGSNGFVGYAVVVGVLQAGYHVRAAVRSQDAVAAISRGSSVLAFLASGALNFVIVPDNTQTAAYVEPAKECSYIIHLASPLPTVPGDLVSKAVAGTRAILEAAEATLSIKRVIFTLSTASLRPFERLFRTHPANQAISSGRSDEVPTITANTMVPTQPPLPDEVPGFHKYVNSKVASRNLVHDYATAHGQKDLHFSIVNIMPGWIFGPEELTRTKAEAFKGSNQVLAFLFSETRINPLLGLEDEKENAPVLAESVHLDDVVEGHVKALDIDGVPGHYQNFLFCSEGPAGPTWMNAVDIVRKDLSDEVAEGLIPLAGKLGTIPFKFDASPTERDLLGHPFRGLTEQVKDLVKWYVHLEHGKQA